MPTPLKTSENMRKHLTKAEKEARQAAEESLERESRVTLKAPDWLSEDARKIWNSIRRKLRGVKLLDNLDSEMLAIYCDACANYRAASKVLAAKDENGLPIATQEDGKTAQAWARITLAYSEKLGLSPTSRARLARKKAETQPLDEMEQLLEEQNFDV